MMRILARRFSLAKLVLGLGLAMLCSLDSDGKASVDRLDSLRLVELADSIQQFEMLCYDSSQISVGRYHRGLSYYDQMIRRMLSLDQPPPDSNCIATAFSYLERKKNLQLLTLLTSGYWPVNPPQLDSNEVITMGLDRLQVGTKAGNALLNSMRQPININAIQKNCLDNKQAIIHFWLDQDRVVAFLVSRDSLLVVQWPCSRRLIEKKIQLLMKPFYANTDLLKLNFSQKTAYDLYQLLFQPLKGHLHQVKSICLIPDDMLLGFPFELLICSAAGFSSMPERALYQHLGSLDYLVRHYAISYNYSTAFMALINDSYHSVKALRHRLLTMSEPASLPNGLHLPFAPEIASFGHNEYEAEEIKRVSRLLFRHDNLRQKQANKIYFLTVGQNYRWIHLTLPTLLDNTNAFNSGIIFSPELGDSIGSSAWLAADEILHAHLSADLLALSQSQLLSFNSCGNPGIIAVPQSFLLAGVRSVLFRIWPVNSLATSQYLAKFYWELKYKRQTTSEALQQAKVASFKESFTFDGREISRAHPFFWAGFLLIGNPQISPPSPTKLPPMAVIALTYAVVILMSFLITRKTMPKRRK